MITQKDINAIMDLLVSAFGDKAYPNDPKQMARVSYLWTVMFQDDDPKEVLVAVKNCIATLQFPPKIADIKARISQSRMAGQMTEMEAWQKIREAVENSYSVSDANRSFNKLSPILKKVVGSPSQLRAWYSCSTDTFEGVIASNVQRSYRELARREATYYALPKDLQTEQSWMVEEPKDVTMLPEPKPQKSFEERQAEMDDEAREYREKQGMTENTDYSDRVSDFKKPMTKNELLELEAKKRHEDKKRMNSWR